ncbi:hypothetical protein CANINC_004083 [Pichia inconspicua]|uniref:Pumilio homology domain family member 3 n=1 Tax=Pichia inconspicua TaxID=52247 RepID=A0A4T0WX58_9ASCO|nr:hypothetical protein CANINC_004083 [[Candida] inconspicua]
MNLNWDALQKASTTDESVISNPWDNSSSHGANLNNLPVPNPISPIISHNNSNQAEDVASIISGLSVTNKLGSHPAPSYLSAYNHSHSLAGFDESAISDSGSDALRDALSAISAPVATQPINKSRFSANLFGSASVAGVDVTSLKAGAFGATKQSSFLEKFASVTEKTREIEANKIGSRRSSMFNNEPKSPQQFFREPRKQSFSEKLESYISATTSPDASRHLSFSSEVAGNLNPTLSEHNSSITEAKTNLPFKRNWNPAAATPFHPSYPANDLSFMQQPMMMSQYQMMPQNFIGGAMYPQMFPPFAGALYSEDANAPQSENMKLTDTTRSECGSKNATISEENTDISEKENADDEIKSDTVDYENEKARTHQKEWDANRPSSPYIITPFNPYNMYGPPGNGFPPMVHIPGSPIAGTAPAPAMIMSPMIGISPVIGGPPMMTRSPVSLNKGRSGSPPRSGRSPGYKKGSKLKNRTKNIVRSPLLEKFRSEENLHFTLNDIVSHAYEFAKDQHGSRFIQQELETAKSEEKEMFFKEISGNAIDLMTDVFGNYVIQKYFEFGSDDQRKVLFESMRGSFNSLSLQMYGCRVVQRCLETVTLDDQLEIMEELKSNILNLVKDQNGNHVIQKAIEQIPTEKIPFILGAIKHQIYRLSLHPYGCRVIQRLLECSKLDDQEFILGELKQYIYYLIQDQFGNYVIQHIIESGTEKDTKMILDVVLDNLIELSKHKFASNAVEKCIVYLPAESRNKIYDVVLFKNSDRDGDLNENTNLAYMIKDPFANYVIQKLIEMVDVERKRVLISKIKQYLKLIQKNTHGKSLASIEKLNQICRSFE